MIAKWECVACEREFSCEQEGEEDAPPCCPHCGAATIDPRFAQSTIDAAIWLICHRPERELREWLDKHSHPKELEKLARERIANKIASSSQ